MSTFEIRVEGRAFTFWERATYSRSLDELCGSFSFSSSEKVGETYPVKKGQKVEIFINKTVVLTGFVDDIINEGSLDGSLVTVIGRDKTSDIVDSSVPSNAKAIDGPVSLRSLCRIVIRGLGADIEAEDETGLILDFTSEDLQAGASAENAFDFLNSFARKRQVYLRTNGAGNLIIFRPGQIKASTILRNEKNNQRNNVKKWSSRNSDVERYHTYVARSQGNIGANPLTDYAGESSSVEGVAIDEEIRDSKYLEIICEESMKTNESTDRAKEESNLRRARSFRYKATLAGIQQDDGSLWDTGLLVTVRDFRCGIFGQFLSRKIALSQSISGSTTTLVVAEPDAYNLEPTLSKTDARKSKINEGFFL